MKVVPLILAGMILLVTGCASVNRLDAARNAVDAGLIDGLDNSSQFSAMVWSWPAKPWGPYSDIGGFTATVTNGTYCGHYLTFFLGRSRSTKQWEVFSTFTWEDGKWKALPVTLPEPMQIKEIIPTGNLEVR